ncbi:MAG: 1-acyl-sn-glycerol-3-phosphate acyltransferase [Alphaproteobacteria bacterium]|nr:1-acyl-sn-glycerol-3-phosphate acyltransferase [Alphaproteobacteria bacterium]MBF0249368.1 1-acyl-sn-glycerol-3-phosphate acyltransferase [Alphaproteobacteria bacterium]
MTHSPAKAAVRTVLLAAVTAGLLPVYLVLAALVPSCRHGIKVLFFKTCLACTGLRVRVHGAPALRAALTVANHVSYLDIPALGSVLGAHAFVAKSEVAGWPVLGLLARMVGTVFIARRAVHAADHLTMLGERLSKGQGVIVFPEGTSTDGSDVAAFKSTLFAVMDRADGRLPVQPVSVIYSRSREALAWWGDMTMPDHLWRVLGGQGGEVDVVFHPPVYRADFRDRKDMTRYCEVVVRDALHAQLGGSLAVEPRSATLAAE